MTSSPERGPRLDGAGSVAARLKPASRDSLLLRGESAASAMPWQRVHRPAPAPRPGPPVVAAAPAPATAPTVPRPAPQPAPQPAAESLTWAEHPAEATRYTGPDRRAGEDRRTGTDRRLRSGPRLGDVYAEQLEQLREQARSSGWAAGHAEGIVAAAEVVAAAEAAAEARLAEAQARWERRLATATAALGAAAAQLEATAAPVVEELRDTILDAVLTLVGDLLGRELATTDTAGLDALRRALTLCPSDVPVVVRLHPDDLAEVPPGELAQLPDSVTVVGDIAVERAGALAEAGTTRVDAQLGTALERVRAVLRS
jgi:flagellar assembly protein FliH